MNPGGYSLLSGHRMSLPFPSLLECLAHGLTNSLFEFELASIGAHQRNPSNFTAPHKQHNGKYTESYLGSFGEEKSNFWVIVVAGSLQRSLACLWRGTGKTGENRTRTVHVKQGQIQRGHVP